MKYEDLTNHPVKYIQNIYRSLEFEYTVQYGESLLLYLDSLKDYKRNQYEIASETRQRVYHECSQIFQEYDYEK